MTGRLSIVLALALGASAWVAAQPAGKMSLDEVVTAYRSDLQSNRAEVIGKNLTLTPGQAAAFWPLFEQYQREQNFIMEEQMKSIQTYISGSDMMDDRGVLQLMNAHIDRDEKMAALRRRWLSEFQQAIPVKQAVRAMQIDRRISLAHQLEFTSQIRLAK